MNLRIPRSAVAGAARALARTAAALALAALPFAGLGSTTPPALAKDTPVLPAAPAQPERVTQSQCTTGTVAVTQPEAYVLFPDMSMAFTAPVAGKVVLHISADLSVPAGAEGRIAYLLDGNPGGEGDFGPSNLASHQDYEETRTTFAVFDVAAGPHTIATYWRVASTNPAHAAVARVRCAVLELATTTEQPLVAFCNDLTGGSEVTITPGAAVQMPGMSLAVNALTAGNAVVRLATDMYTAPGSEVRLLYKVDGGAPQEAVFGPANLANHQEFWETRNTVAVIPLTVGAHTISAYWRLSGAPADTAIFQRGCMVVEPPTNAGSATVTDCHTSLTGLVPADGQQPLPGLSALVVMPQAGNAIVHLATDMGVTPGAEVRLAYSVNGGPATEYAFGPGNIANSQDYWETRGAVAVIPLGAGAHTITPYWRVSGSPGNSGTFQRGCLTVSPTTVVGGPNFRITTPIQVAWDGGNAQTGYQLLKYNTSTAAATLLPLAANAIAYADLATVDGVVYCYVVATTGPTGVLGLSDLECALTGQQSGPNVPVSFTLDFNGPSSVLLTWFTPAGGLDSILVQRIPLDGTPPSAVALPGGATASSQALTAAGTCFQIVGFKSITVSTTNVLCGVPGVGTLAATGKTAGEALAEVAERLQGLRMPEAAGFVHVTQAGSGSE